MFRVALISRWHTHARENRYTDQMKKMDDVSITCCWDFDIPRGQQWAEELNVDFEPDLDKLLAREDVDGLCITAPTDMHKDIIVKAAQAGKHCFTEKALAMDYAEALEIQKAVEDAGVQMGVVFPRRSNPEFSYAKKLYDEGAFGDVCLMHVRNAVTNLANLPLSWFRPEPLGGGGAIRDLACHTIDLACWILGEPESISTTAGYLNGWEVDDTGVCTIKFKNKAIAMIDSTFSAPLCNNWYNMEIYGSKLAYLADSERVTVIHDDGTKEVFPISDLPTLYPQPLRQWINAATGQGELICGVEAGVMVNRVLDAAALSLKEQRTVNV